MKLRRRTPWHVWSTINGNVIPPERVNGDLWKALRHRPFQESGDGNWREYQDEHGATTLVLVKL